MNNYVCEKCGYEREQLEQMCNNCHTHAPYAASVEKLQSILGDDWRTWFVGDWSSVAPLGGHDIRWFVRGGLVNIYMKLGYDIGDRIAYIWGYDRDKGAPIERGPFFKNRGVWWVRN